MPSVSHKALRRVCVRLYKEDHEYLMQFGRKHHGAKMNEAVRHAVQCFVVVAKEHERNGTLPNFLEEKGLMRLNKAIDL